jgi:hypothetical protein
MHACAGEGAAELPQQELTALNVELGAATPVVEAYAALCALRAEAHDLERMAAREADADMRTLAAEERASLLLQVRGVPSSACSAMRWLQETLPCSACRYLYLLNKGLVDAHVQQLWREVHACLCGWVL